MPGDALAIFDEAGLPAVGVASYHDLKWSKLLLNLLANAQAAILDTDAATIAGDPRPTGPCRLHAAACAGLRRRRLAP